MVKEDGTIIGSRGIPLRPRINSRGYLTLTYKGVNEVIHRLVAKKFVPNPLNLNEVNHKDGNKLNNHKDNLEWCTRQENLQHAQDIGLRKNSMEQVPVIGIKDGIETLFKSQAEAARASGAKQGNINKVCKGLRKTAGGYKWRYTART